ncbi:hypothetical protein [Novosphingobium sp. ST904]|uniref:hypothetical protein n=1 Tax=Novosphingobium sp. ST904 TaxID=1684385 RepID=UPI0006CD5600|nr:hypothetical protein [Novosphingobium sp. ST904]KPH65792.1 hypothetical protein ADT71_09650 [Novosphingobium sp. ST904]TCM29073.1 hypothetical protein EDF59_1287 [Novosphingobium sp. ST904]
MSIALTLDAFPAVEGLVRAQWAPVLLNPVAGSAERFVIGVAAVNGAGFVLEQANALERLRCLYGASAEAAIFAAVVALEQLENEFASRGADALSQARAFVSGVEIGPIREGEGPSLKAIAASWMIAMSSLYKVDNTDEADETSDISSSAGEGIDRLPRLVMDYVGQHDPRFSRFFRQDLIGGQRRRKSHEITIDFNGARLVANFGVLQPGGIAKSVDHIKRRLWDLKVRRDAETDSFIHRHHEMIIQMPSEDDPILTPRQHANLKEAHRSLEQQADQEELRLRPLPTVPAIGQRVIAGESGLAA